MIEQLQQREGQHPKMNLDRNYGVVVVFSALLIPIYIDNAALEQFRTEAVPG